MHTAPTHRNIRITSSTYYTSILDTIPTALTGTSNSTLVHNTLATRSINGLDSNSVMGIIPPKVDDSEAELSRDDRVHLTRLRCEHNNSLLSQK